jgi:hypothetical protein
LDLWKIGGGVVLPGFRVVVRAEIRKNLSIIDPEFENSVKPQPKTPKITWLRHRLPGKTAKLRSVVNGILENQNLHAVEVKTCAGVFRFL